MRGEQISTQTHAPTRLPSKVCRGADGHHVGHLFPVGSELDRPAVVSSVVLFLMSTLLLWNKSMEYLATTPLGRVMLVYATPLTFLIYNVSALPVIYGAWTHQVIYILRRLLNHAPASLVDVEAVVSLRGPAQGPSTVASILLIGYSRCDLQGFFAATRRNSLP